MLDSRTATGIEIIEGYSDVQVGDLLTTTANHRTTVGRVTSVANNHFRYEYPIENSKPYGSSPVMGDEIKNIILVRKSTGKKGLSLLVGENVFSEWVLKPSEERHQQLSPQQ
jgi:hypothetical protein